MSLARIEDAGLSEDAIKDLMLDMGAKARKASAALGRAPAETKTKALLAMAQAIRARASDILAANAVDMEDARAADLSPAMLDRLLLDDKRIEGMAKGIEDIAALNDPVGSTIAEWERPNGLRIARVRVPLGVIAIIYESRPNVTADAGALCLKSGNAVILRGGKESFHSSRAIHACLAEGLKAAGLPETAIQLVPTKNRAAVGVMLKDMTHLIDVVIPRGGKSLIARVQADARIPVMGHLEGLCHVYADKDADLDKAVQLLVNSKMRRTGICGASETLLVDSHAPAEYLPALVHALMEAGCEVRGDDVVQKTDTKVVPATEEDWTTEYLDAIISVKVVDGLDAAIAHIETYGSQHTEAILTENQATADRFLTLVDSAIVLHNASTQFADGGEFGMGAEIGIATGKLHARGPVGAEQLTSYKYVVRGTGQTRP